MKIYIFGSVISAIWYIDQQINFHYREHIVFWQTLNIRFRDISCQIFRVAIEIVRLRHIGYIKYYISFSKYPEFTRSKLRNVFYEMEFNIKKSTKGSFLIDTGSTTIPAFALYNILKMKYLLGAPNDISYLCMTFLLHIVSSILSYYS